MKNLESKARILLEVGVSGFLFSGSGIPGPTWILNLFWAMIFAGVAALGYKLMKIAERRKRDSEAAKEIECKAKDATFESWVRLCNMDVQVRR